MYSRIQIAPVVDRRAFAAADQLYGVEVAEQDYRGVAYPQYATSSAARYAQYAYADDDLDIDLSSRFGKHAEEALGQFMHDTDNALSPPGGCTPFVHHAAEFAVDGTQVSVDVCGLRAGQYASQQAHVNAASYAGTSTEFAAGHAPCVPADPRPYGSQEVGPELSHADAGSPPSPSRYGRDHQPAYVIAGSLAHFKQEPQDDVPIAASWPVYGGGPLAPSFPDSPGLAVPAEDQYVTDLQYADADYGYDDTAPISPLSDSAYGDSEDLDFGAPLPVALHHPSPFRSYTLAAAITPLPEPAPKHEPKRAVSLPAATPQPAASASTPPSAAAPAPRPRGRPRKKPVAQVHAVGYPYPAPLSLDELPLPDREGKPGQALFRLTTTGGPREPPKKKPVMACLFCRERKIACGPPVPGSAELRCNQCARRSLRCEYPKESRRGQHKRGPRAARVQALADAHSSSGSSSNSSSETLPDVFPRAVPMDVEWGPIRSA